jgi:hypothetical protein
MKKAKFIVFRKEQNKQILKVPLLQSAEEEKI